MRILEKEILFNRYLAGNMGKEELTVLVKSIILENELHQWFTVLIEFFMAFRDPPKFG